MSLLPHLRQRVHDRLVEQPGRLLRVVQTSRGRMMRTGFCGACCSGSYDGYVMNSFGQRGSSLRTVAATCRGREHGRAFDRERGRRGNAPLPHRLLSRRREHGSVCPRPGARRGHGGSVAHLVAQTAKCRTLRVPTGTCGLRCCRPAVCASAIAARASGRGGSMIAAHTHQRAPLPGGGELGFRRRTSCRATFWCSPRATRLPPMGG